MLFQSWRHGNRSGRIVRRCALVAACVSLLAASMAKQARADVVIADNWAAVAGGGGEVYYDGFVSFAGNAVEAPVDVGGNLWGKFTAQNTWWGEYIGVSYINTLVAPDQFNAHDTLRLTIDTSNWNWLHLSLQAIYTTSDEARTGTVSGTTGYILRDDIIPVNGGGGVHVIDIPLADMDAGTQNPRYVDPGGYNNGIAGVFAGLGLFFQAQGGATPNGGYDFYFDPNWDNGFDPETGDPLPPGTDIDDLAEVAASTSGPPDTPVQGGHFPYILIDKIELISSVASDGDYNDDGNIDADDIDILWAIVRGTGSDPNANDAGDLNGDSFVNEDDVDHMLANLLDAGTGRQYGDADLDGGVGGLDFTAWRLRAGTGWANGDFDGDGGIGGLDFTLWRTRPSVYPSDVGPHSGLAAVPEPGTLVLLGLGLPALALVARRRKGSV